MRKDGEGIRERIGGVGERGGYRGTIYISGGENSTLEVRIVTPHYSFQLDMKRDVKSNNSTIVAVLGLCGPKPSLF